MLRSVPLALVLVCAVAPPGSQGQVTPATAASAASGADTAASGAQASASRASSQAAAPARTGASLASLGATTAGTGGAGTETRTVGAATPAAGASSPPLASSWSVGRDIAIIVAAIAALTLTVAGASASLFALRVWPWRPPPEPPRMDDDPPAPPTEGYAFRRHWGSFGGESTGWSMSPRLAQLLTGLALALAGVTTLWHLLPTK